MVKVICAPWISPSLLWVRLNEVLRNINRKVSYIRITECCHFNRLMKSGILPTDEDNIIVTLKAESVFKTEKGFFKIEFLNMHIFFRDHKYHKICTQ